jgi:YVTN family beta-propeller protein
MGRSIRATFVWFLVALSLGLLVLGCGGGGAGGSSTGVTVTVTPKTVTLILNATQQFIANVTGGAAAVATIVSGNGAVRGANVVTITTTSPHGLGPAQIVTISGVSDSSFNGTFAIATAPSTTTFTYAQTGSDATSGGGTVSTSAVKWSVSGVEGGNTTFGTISTTGLYTAPAALPPATTTSIASSGAVRSNNVVTITTTAAHNLGVGQVVIISGVADTSFNGTFSLQTVPSSTTFTFSQTASNATSGGGTVSSTAVQVKVVSVADSTKSDTAIVSVDSGLNISVSPKTATVGTSEAFQFFATIAGSTNTNVNWSVTGGSSNGTISTNGLYTAPATVPSPATVTVTATAAADPNKSATASVTVVTAADPTLTAVSPTHAAQGSLFQDVYLTGTNFISTTTVLAGSTVIPATAVSNTLMRARIPDCVLSAVGAFNIVAQRQSGTMTPPQTFTVASVRPALVGASPDSGIEGGAAFSFNVNGGYFGTSAPCTPPTSPAVTAEFDGKVRPATVAARQLSVTIGGAGSGDLSTPGLFSVAVRNTSATLPVAVTNVAVQPSPLVTPPSVVTTITMPPMGTATPLPGAVAVNTTNGIAVVANRGTNSISLIDLTTSPPSISGAPIAVGTSPTGVAVDSVRNLAVVANNGSNNVSIVNLATRAVTTLSTNINNMPFSVGVNPLSGRALVAYQSTNNASLIDLTANPPVVIAPVSISTGQTAQVAVEPRLNWAIVTPGGAGTLSIVDLGRITVNAIVAAPSGAVRSNNLVTITTTTTLGLTPNEVVLITGVADASFNGTFTVTSVPSSTTFTYAQTAPNRTSGGGSVIYALPLATATLGINLRGIGVNPESEKALMTDPTASSLILFSVLDQTVTTFPPPGPALEPGMVAAAVNPLTDIGVTINPGTGTGPGVASLIDPRTPTRLATVTVGTNPKAVAIDPTTNLALVANEGSNNVTVISLGGAIRPLHVTEISPIRTFTSASPLTLTVTGKGFTSNSVVRLDGTPLPAPTGVTDRQLSVTVPAAFLSAPRRFALEVVTGSTHSNVADLTVLQSVDVTSSGCSVPAPGAVAIDAERNLAVVTNTGCGNISLIDLTSGAVTNTIAVGTNPQGVAVISRLGRAVVTNRGSNNASLVDLVGGTVTSTVTVGTEPIGVAINQDTAMTVVTNSASNNISVFPADVGGSPAAVAVDQRPVAVAIDPGRNVAVVADAAQNNLILLDLSQTTPAITARVSTSQPTGVVFDPVSGFFLIASSLANSLVVLNPDTQQATSLRVGINPTSLAFNFQSSTLVTVNTASNTVSVMDFQTERVRAILGLTGSPQFAVDIHPRTNLAVIADQNNNRVLLVPLPR